MRVFDLHCDTLTECMKRQEPLAQAGGHISLARGAALEQWGQVFAIFVPEQLQGDSAAAWTQQTLDFFARQQREIQRVCLPVLAIENGSALAGRLELLDTYAAQGVKLITLTWNGKNELGCGAMCGPRPGLTPFGRQAVLRMFELGIIPDVSHLNEAGFWDVAELAAINGKSFWATHSNCYAIHPHCRNLNDQQLRAIVSCKGLVGINLYTKFLGGAGTAEDAARHLAHMIALGGEDCAALGSDFDGCDIHPSLAGIERLEHLNSELERLGVPQHLREKFFWSNTAKHFAGYFTK